LTIQEKWAYYLGEEVQIAYAMDYLKAGELRNEDKRVASHILPNRKLADSIKNLGENSILIYQGEEIAFNKASSNSIKIAYQGEITFIKFPWHFYLENDAEIRKDYDLLTAERTSAHVSSDIKVIGENIFIEPGAKLHSSIINTDSGPVYIGKNAEVMEGAMIRGPFALCDNAQVKMGAKIYGATTIGPGCKVGGEIGNSVIGEWCNLGADTNSSNLKNNYSKVEIFNYHQKAVIETGQQFLGMIMGDHSKSGINTMFNTGTVVGVCSNIVGAGFPKKHIPSFSWSISEKIRPYDLEKAFETIHAVYARRSKIITDREVRILSHIYNITMNSSS
jgi:UDP-N-acetylglucosamine diphosphorylase/glucosamine-1-phosphate N-acetyltransferase